LKKEGQGSWFGWKKQKTPKTGAKIEKNRAPHTRQTKSIPPPLKSLTKRWKPYKIINILGMISAAHIFHLMYTTIVGIMLGFWVKLITSKF
jgi:hypothetical protein